MKAEVFSAKRMGSNANKYYIDKFSKEKLLRNYILK